MNLIKKALWFVESHSREEMSLESIAKVCQVSTYHLTRAFAFEKGISLMRYVRARRLTEAAKKLITTSDNILDVAIEFGYGSHEAFTRAFRDQFQVPPGILKSSEDLTKITLVEAFTMKESSKLNINEPRIEELATKSFVGLKETYDCNAPAGIPDQWQSFYQYLGHIDGQLTSDANGICYNFDDQNRFDYLNCVEVSHSKKPGSGLIS